MHGSRRKTALLMGVLLVALVAPGCSSGDDSASASSAPTDPGPVITGVRTAAEQLAFKWGDEGAFLAVLAALDRGYLVSQVTAAADSGSLRADGTIPGVDPMGDPSGLLTSPATGILRSSSAPSEEPQDAFIATVNRSASEVFAVGRQLLNTQQTEELLVGILLHLVARGYSLEQIVNGIVLGQITIESRTLGCWLLSDGGVPLAAARKQLPDIPCPPPGAFTSPTTSEPQSAPSGSGDGTYTGGIVEWLDGWDVRDSSVTATVSGTQVTLTIEYVAAIPYRRTEGNLVCTLVVNVLASGRGELGTEFTLTVDSAGVLDASGSECGDSFPWPRPAADQFVLDTAGSMMPAEARVEADALLGKVVLPLLEFEAVRI